MNALFDKLFGNLVSRWKRYDDAPRTPDRVIELASARADLDDARAQTADARERLFPSKIGDQHNQRQFKKYDSDYIYIPNPQSGGG